MISEILRFLAIILSLVAFLMLPHITRAETISVGDISNKPAEKIGVFTPFVNYLARQLQPEGIDQGKVVVVRNIPEMANQIKEGKVDLFIDSPFPAMAVSRLANSKFLLRHWKRGVAEYRAIIFVKKDSGIGRLEDLKGKTIAFEEPDSTSTYFMPKLVMVQRGLKLALKKDPSSPVGPDEVGYLFVGDEPNAMFWVLRDKAAAGVMNNQNYLQEARGYSDSLRVIHETFSLPRQVVTYRSDLNPKLVAKVREVLLKMDQSEEGRKVLKDFQRTTKFDELPDGAMAPLLKAGNFIDAEFRIK
jgi:phosphonate transport system substrate-binding protein